MEKSQISWKYLLFEGIAFIILGVIAATLPGLTTLSFELLIGSLLVIGGLSQVWRSFKQPSTSELIITLLSGIIYGVTGVLLWVYPLVGMLTLTVLVALFFLLEGIIKIIAAIRLYKVGNIFWLFLSGVIALAMAGLIWYGWPTAGIWFIGLLIGINMIFYGCTAVIVALSLRKAIKKIDNA